MSAVKLSNKGKLYNYTVVHRNFPGVPVPFISAIVDLDGGGCLKGNLVDMVPQPRGHQVRHAGQGRLPRRRPQGQGRQLLSRLLLHSRLT